MTMNTPGVYVKEVSTLPPSVAQVATAIPAFIGYTSKRVTTNTTGSGAQPVEVEQITSMLEYEERFGKAGATTFSFNSNDELAALSDPFPRGMLWYAIKHYFDNGGGRCYVLSVGSEDTTPAPQPFLDGLAELARFDEPTLIVMPELVKLGSDDFGSICQKALGQCRSLTDRFAILDVPRLADGPGVDNAATFRDKLGANDLMYGAAYYPYLETTLNYVYDETSVTAAPKPAEKGNSREDTKPAEDAKATSANPSSLADLKTSETARYNKLKKILAEQRVTLPPSAAVAGIYVRVDRERGVWKAPANVGVMSVIRPTVTLTDAEQETLNVDPTSGKSINAIRAFTGRGILLWGARTLDGNSNEWRYVPVRRLFIMIEESAKKATSFAVFEPNDATTWLKVKGMVEAFLFGLWEQGALQGSKPEDAYYVNVGLGKTMTSQDVLEGRLTVEIGVAAVRPAEFIELRFSHKLAQS